MDTNLFRTLAQEVFGNAWRTEIARHFGVTPRAVRYWESGEFTVRYDVDLALREWTKEGGWMAQMLARVQREIYEVMPSRKEEYDALCWVKDWLDGRIPDALERFIEIQDEARRSDEYKRLAEHASDVLTEGREHAWRERGTYDRSCSFTAAVRTAQGLDP